MILNLDRVRKVQCDEICEYERINGRQLLPGYLVRWRCWRIGRQDNWHWLSPMNWAVLSLHLRPLFKAAGRYDCCCIQRRDTRGKSSSNGPLNIGYQMMPPGIS